MKKTIALDCRMIGRSGVGRYVESILDQITSQDIEDFQFILVGSLRRLSEYESKKNIMGVEPYEIEPLSIKDTVLGTSLFKGLSNRVDLVHFTHINLPLIVPANSIVTVHDLTPLILKDLFPLSKRLFLASLLKFNKRRIKQFIAVSQSTKNDLIKLLKIRSEKIEVIYERVSSRLVSCNRILPEELKDREYFLYVGNRKRHKNLDTAIKAFDVFFDEHPDWRFVIAGRKDTPRDYVDETLDKVRNRNCFIEYENPPDEILAGLYSKTKAVVLLSLYEGFGLPVIEGFAFGKPAIVSNSSSLPEIVGNAGFVVSTNGFYLLPNVISRMADEPVFYENLRVEVEKRFSFFDTYSELERLKALYEAIFDQP